MNQELTEVRPGPRWQRRKGARPAEILDAALREFVVTGYAATRLEDIARRAGVTKGTMYLYFANKEELFKAVIERTLAGERRAIEQTLAAHGGDERSRLEDLLREIWARLVDSDASGLVKLLVAESAAFPELVCHCQEQIVRPHHARIADIIRRGMRSGEFRSTLDAGAIAWQALGPLVVGALWKHSFQAVVSGEGLDPSAYLDQSLRLLFDAICAPADTVA